MWPFTKREVRQAPYTDAITAAIISANSGTVPDADPYTTAALEIGVGVLSRAFALAEVENADIDPETLSDMVRRLVTSGEGVYYYGGSQITPVAGWEITGNYVRDSWRYIIEIPTPSGKTISINTGINRIIHPRYSFDANQPWIGIGPLQRAREAGLLQANVETKLNQEMSGTVGYLLPIPTAGDDESVVKLKSDISALKGKTAVVETTAGGWGEGRLAAPSQDYQPKRIGPSPPESVISTARHNQLSILAALGVPVEIVQPADGTGQREAWRRCLHGTIQPLGRILSYELSRVYGRRVNLNFDALMASDIQGRARAFQSMVGGGMDVNEAAAQSGLLVDDSVA